MELTVNQALLQGVEAHKEGRLQDAERCYRAILEVQPNHPDANHNLGVLIVSTGKTLDAVPLFESALVANPQVKQFWLSYIDALITVERFHDAKNSLAAAEGVGLSEHELKGFLEQLPEHPAKPLQSFSGGEGSAPSKKKRATRKRNSKPTQSHNESLGPQPPRQQIDLILGHYSAGRLSEAEELSTLLTKQFPHHPFAWKVLGVLLQQAGRLDESLLPLQTAVDLAPHDAEAHNNLGISFKNLGKLTESVTSYGEAIRLKPDFAEAHSNLGNVLRRLGRSAEAEQSCRKAIAHDPNLASAYNNLGNSLSDLGRVDAAISAYAQAVTLKADFANAYVGLGCILKKVRFSQADASLYPLLINLLTSGNFVRPSHVAGAICSLLKQEPNLKTLILRSRSLVNLEAALDAIEILRQYPLLHHLLRICPLPDLQIEGVLASVRKAMITNLDVLKESPDVINFLSTLSLHCFTNEYVYYESVEETHLVDKLAGEVARAVATENQPPLLKVLCMAVYRPLSSYEWSQNLTVLDQVPDVKQRLIDEVYAEGVIREGLQVLEEATDEVSCQVRAQYEDNPYPRWVKPEIPTKPTSVAEIFSEGRPRLLSREITSLSSLSILVAGCGTGQHSIETATQFDSSRVIAVDLSLASLAYASRKTSELGLSNIEYIHADILQLHNLRQKFDLIESVGVLHHMDEPMAGWSNLVGLLRPGGLMKIGLYSASARSHIAAARDEIKALGLGASESEIRSYRQFLIESQSESHRRLTRHNDFFSLSMLRDLLFHVQEHRFTLLQIKDCLDQLGLEFCGFLDPDIVSQFCECMGEQADVFDLSMWHQFEIGNPTAFTGMYQFYCQKR